MIISKIAFFVSILVVLFTPQTFAPHTLIHESLKLCGLLLVALCAMGRLYATAFLGGHKNSNLITQGPFSVVRNPLYVFSLIGVTGVALMSNHLILIICIPVLFFVLYLSLVKREEAFLRDAFGKEYEDYCKHVPRFFPDLSKYNAAENLVMSPKQLWHAFRDNLVWFVPSILFEVIEAIRPYIQFY